MSNLEEREAEYKKLTEDHWRLHDERMAILLFAKVMESDEAIEKWDIAFRGPNVYPDGVLYMKSEGDEFYLNVEFEGYSSNFKDHHHDSKNCDLIICTLHDWKEAKVPVMEVYTDGTCKLFELDEGIKGSLYELWRNTRRS